MRVRGHVMGGARIGGHEVRSESSWSFSDMSIRRGVEGSEIRV